MKWQYLYTCAIKLRVCMDGMVCIKSWVSEWSIKFNLWIMKKVVLKVCMKSSWILDWNVCLKMNFRLKNMCELCGGFWGRKLLNNKQTKKSKDKFSKLLFWAIYASVIGGGNCHGEAGCFCILLQCTLTSESCGISSCQFICDDDFRWLMIILQSGYCL